MNIPTKNWLEWSVFAISTLLVVAVLGYLAFAAVTMGDSPALLVAEVGEEVQQSQGFVVPVTITNRGDETAEDVQIEVTLSQNGSEIERSEFSIAFVPRRSSGDGWVMFRQNPADGQLSAKVLGYAQP